jgi:hypothetical protein
MNIDLRNNSDEPRQREDTEKVEAGATEDTAVAPIQGKVGVKGLPIIA